MFNIQAGNICTASDYQIQKKAVQPHQKTALIGKATVNCSNISINLNSLFCALFMDYTIFMLLYVLL